MLTKKYFRAIAEIIEKAHNRPCGLIVAKPFIEEIADYFVGQNPNFDREKFLKACGL